MTTETKAVHTRRQARHGTAPKAQMTDAAPNISRSEKRKLDRETTQKLFDSALKSVIELSTHLSKDWEDKWLMYGVNQAWHILHNIRPK